MSSGMPELGSKISLISKADIRYEGRLFTVDPQECTIALASVRSFGTEDRETQYPVAPQNQVYDYILFRGSDIKDIRVVNNVPSLPNDPAIMQLSVPPSLGPGGGGVGGPYQQAQFSHPVVGPAQYPAYHPMGGLPPAAGLRPNPMAKQPSELPPPAPLAPPQQAKDQGSMLEMISGASRSETPLGLQRKSPTAEQGTQVGGPQQQQSGQLPNKGQHNNRNQQQRPRSQNRNANNQNMNQQNQHHQQSNQQHHQQQNQHNQPQNSQQQHSQQHNQQHNQQQHQQHHQQQHQQQHLQHQQNNQPHHSNQQQHHQQHNNQGPNGMRQNNQGWIRGRGGRGGRGGPRGGFGGRGGNRTKNTLKFDNDYDFEQANTEFEELRSQLVKVKIADGEVPKPEVETEKKDDSGNETGAGEPEPEDDGGDSANCYDKTKSFFDNISCEAVERSKGRSQRTDWRTERKLNSETFGVAMARRGGYRGRGYWGGPGGGGWGAPGGWGGRGWGGPRGGPHRQPHRPRQQPPPLVAGK